MARLRAAAASLRISHGIRRPGSAAPHPGRCDGSVPRSGEVRVSVARRQYSWARSFSPRRCRAPGNPRTHRSHLRDRSARSTLLHRGGVDVRRRLQILQRLERAIHPQQDAAALDVAGGQIALQVVPPLPVHQFSQQVDGPVAVLEGGRKVPLVGGGGSPAGVGLRPGPGRIPGASPPPPGERISPAPGSTPRRLETGCRAVDRPAPGRCGPWPGPVPSWCGRLCPTGGTRRPGTSSLPAAPPRGRPSPAGRRCGCWRRWPYGGAGDRRRAALSPPPGREPKPGPGPPERETVLRARGSIACACRTAARSSASDGSSGLKSRRPS